MKEGYRQGKLVALRQIQKGKKNPYQSSKWLCKCDCGNEKIINQCNLYGNNTNSCGCLEFKNKKIYDRNDYFEILKKRILEKIDVNINGCWIWTGSKHRQGYGSIRFKNKYGLLHRVVWEIYNGEIPDEIKVCHRCDIVACCNPEHLFLGSQKDNVDDSVIKGRFKPGKLPRRNKLNYEQVQEILTLFEEGMTRKELRKKYKVSQTCIEKIVTGKSWKHNWKKEI